MFRNKLEITTTTKKKANPPTGALERRALVAIVDAHHKRGSLNGIECALVAFDADHLAARVAPRATSPRRLANVAFDIVSV